MSFSDFRVLFDFLLSFPHLFFAIAVIVPDIHCLFTLLLALKELTGPLSGLLSS